MEKLLKFCLFVTLLTVNLADYDNFNCEGTVQYINLSTYSMLFPEKLLIWFKT
jgi:hypothetical protein